MPFRFAPERGPPICELMSTRARVRRRTWSTRRQRDSTRQDSENGPPTREANRDGGRPIPSKIEHNNTRSLKRRRVTARHRMVALPGGTPALQVEKARMSKLNGPSLRGGIDFGCNAASLPTTQAMPPESVDFVGTPRLDFEGWRAFLRTTCGNQPDVIDPSAFTAWVRPISVCGLAAAALKIECGFTALDSGRNAYRSERTYRDARLAGADYYYAVFQVAGRSAMTQNDEVVQLAVGDVALLDAARPAACFADKSQCNI